MISAGPQNRRRKLVCLSGPPPGLVKTIPSSPGPGVGHDVRGQVRRDQLGYRHDALTGL
jgi:hypothetical protein